MVADCPSGAWERFGVEVADELETEDFGIVTGKGPTGRKSTTSDLRFEVGKKSDSEEATSCEAEFGIFGGAVAELGLELFGVAELRAEIDADLAPGIWASFPEGALPFPGLRVAGDCRLSVIGSGR